MNMITCPNCKIRVLPRSDGTCPSCQAIIPQKGSTSLKKHGTGNEPDPIRQQILRSMDLKETQELLDIWVANNRDEWSEDAFAAIKELLQVRGVGIPGQHAKNSSTKMNAEQVPAKVANKKFAQKHYDLALQLWEKSKYEEALKESNRAIELAPGWSEAHNLRGVILEDMDQPDESVLEYREAARLDPDNKDVKINLHVSDKTRGPANPQATYEIAYGVVYFVGALNFILGLVAVLFNVKFLQQFGFSLVSCLYGLVFLVLGYFVHKKRSIIALVLAIAIYGLDSLVAVIPILSQGSFLSAGLLIGRVIFITPMIQGVKAIQALNQPGHAGKKNPTG